MLNNYMGRKMYEEEQGKHTSTMNSVWGEQQANKQYMAESIYLTKKQQSFNEVQNFGSYLDKITEE